jgi:acid phosphatase type 7
MTSGVIRAVATSGAMIAFCAALHSQDLPQRVILNLTDSPSTSMAITWRTQGSYADTKVEYAVATPGPTFDKSAQTSTAQSNTLDLGIGRRWYQSSARLTGLSPSTEYAYRVGHDSVWSEWNQFRTASNEPAPFSFVYMGDPQDDIREHVSRAFRQAFKGASDARFWLFTGDLTSDPDDDLWQEWFEAAGFIPRMVPMMLTPGNHDHASLRINGKKERTRELPLWRAQFTLPENGVPGLEELSYVVDYQGVRFLMLYSSNALKEQAEWVDRVLADNPNRWTVAAFHHPFYSSGRSRDERSTRDAFQAVFEQRGVDLVLQGHDHTYARSKKLLGGRVVGESERGIVYVVSSCGPKNYVLQPLYKDLMATMGENQQLYQVIAVEGNRLKFTSMTMAGTVFDSFELRK